MNVMSFSTYCVEESVSKGLTRAEAEILSDTFATVYEATLPFLNLANAAPDPTMFKKLGRLLVGLLFDFFLVDGKFVMPKLWNVIAIYRIGVAIVRAIKIIREHGKV